jgi:hypothetical protein
MNLIAKAEKLIFSVEMAMESATLRGKWAAYHAMKAEKESVEASIHFKHSGSQLNSRMRMLIATAARYGFVVEGAR